MGERAIGPRRHAGRLAWVALAALAIPVGAAAASRESRQVEVILPQCSAKAFSTADFLLALRAQLADEGVTVQERRLPNEERNVQVEVVIACDPKATQANLIVTSRTGEMVQRVLSLSELPTQARSRGLGLAAAELLRAMAHRQQPSAGTSASSAPPLALDTARELGPERARTSEKHTDGSAAIGHGAEPVVRVNQGPEKRGRLVIELDAEGRFYSRPSTFAPGAALEIGTERLWIGATWLSASKSAEEQGSVHGTLVTGSLGLRLWRKQWERVGVELGPHLGAGMVHAYGESRGAARENTAVEPYVEGAVQVKGLFRLVEGGQLVGGLGVGMSRGLIGTIDGGEQLALGGAYVGMKLGIRLSP